MQQPMLDRDGEEARRARTRRLTLLLVVAVLAVYGGYIAMSVMRAHG
jgi:hypothetical protein